MAALALAALGGGPAELLRTGRDLVTAGCFLAAGVSVLRGRRPERRPLARALFAVSALMGLYVLAVALDGPAASPVAGPLPPGWIPLLTSAGGRSAGRARSRSFRSGSPGPSPRRRSGERSPPRRWWSTAVPWRPRPSPTASPGCRRRSPSRCWPGSSRARYGPGASPGTGSWSCCWRAVRTGGCRAVRWPPPSPWPSSAPPTPSGPTAWCGPPWSPSCWASPSPASTAGCARC
ncbi:hypothetical protein [Streptomyces thioluteus]|uniref:hypothetical protein n=1 Tax=Streptomyces thioluteus TaxID=66431 RepID=UPI0031EC7771